MPRNRVTFILVDPSDPMKILSGTHSHNIILFKQKNIVSSPMYSWNHLRPYNIIFLHKHLSQFKCHAFFFCTLYKPTRTKEIKTTKQIKNQDCTCSAAAVAKSSLYSLSKVLSLAATAESSVTRECEACNCRTEVNG